MSFEAFVEAIIARFFPDDPRAEDRVKVRNDRDEGKYVARIPGGICIIHRPGSLKITVRHHGHQHMEYFA